MLKMSSGVVSASPLRACEGRVTELLLLFKSSSQILSTSNIDLSMKIQCYKLTFNMKPGVSTMVRLGE